MDTYIFVQNLINHTSYFIMKSKFFEIVHGFLKKCMNVSCCVGLVSNNMNKILFLAFYQNMLHSIRVLTSMAKRLVFPFRQITLRYSCVTDSESWWILIYSRLVWLHCTLSFFLGFKDTMFLEMEVFLPSFQQQNSSH